MSPGSLAEGRLVGAEVLQAVCVDKFPEHLLKLGWGVSQTQPITAFPSYLLFRTAYSFHKTNVRDPP